MNISVRDLQNIALHAQGMAEEARQLAEAFQTIADDCAEQLAKRREENTADTQNNAVQKAEPAAMQEFPEPTPFEEGGSDAEALSLGTLRAFVASRSTPDNRPKIKEILTRFGVKKLTELQESQYAAVQSEVEKACPIRR